MGISLPILERQARGRRDRPPTARESIFDLGRWVRRLQFKRSYEPEFSYSIQPVQIVSDVRTLSPEVRSPSAIWGGQQAAAVAEFGVFALEVNAPGGVIATNFGWSLGTPGSVQVNIGPIPPWFNPPPLETFKAVQQPTTTCRGFVGSQLVSPGVFPNLLPTFPGGAINIPAYWGGEIFVRNGQHLIISALQPNSVFRVGFTAQELPAMRGD